MRGTHYVFCNNDSPENGPPRSAGVISGLRYYNAELGRWGNRDPIGEEGGVNLYAGVENSPMMTTDALGRKAWLMVNAPPGTETYQNDVAEWNAKIELSRHELRETLKKSFICLFKWWYQDESGQKYEDKWYSSEEFLRRVEGESIGHAITPRESLQGDVAIVQKQASGLHKDPWDNTMHVAHVDSGDYVHYEKDNTKVKRSEVSSSIEAIQIPNGWVMFLGCKGAKNGSGQWESWAYPGKQDGSGGCDVRGGYCYWYAARLTGKYESPPKK